MLNTYAGGRHHRLLLYFCFLLTLHTAAWAHTKGENYIFLNFRETSIDGRFEFRFDDLKTKLGVDLKAEGTPPDEAVKLHAGPVENYIQSHFSIGPKGTPPYDLVFTNRMLFRERSKYAQYYFYADAGPLPDKLELRHELCFENDRLHRGIVVVGYNARTDTQYSEERVAMVFSPWNRVQTPRSRRDSLYAHPSRYDRTRSPTYLDRDRPHTLPCSAGSSDRFNSKQRNVEPGFFLYTRFMESA